MYNDRQWKPQHHLNYFARNSPNKKRKVLNPGHLLQQVQSNLIVPKSQLKSTRKKTISLNISDVDKHNHSNQECETITDYILIHDQQSEDVSLSQLQRQVEQQSWISIEQIPMKSQLQQGMVKVGVVSEEGVQFRRAVIQQQLQLRRFDKKSQRGSRKNSQNYYDQHKSRKGSYQRSVLKDQSEVGKELVREFSFGEKAVPFPTQDKKKDNNINGRDEKILSASRMFRELFNEDQIRKLEEMQARKAKLRRKKYVGKSSNSNSSSGKKVISPRDSENQKQRQWQSFINNLIINNPRKQSVNSNQDYYHIDKRQQDIPSNHFDNIISQKNDNRNLKGYRNEYQYGHGDEQIYLDEAEVKINKKSVILQEGSVNKQELLVLSSMEGEMHKRINKKYSYEDHKREEMQALKREKELLEAQWEQLERSNKVNYVAKPNGSSLQQKYIGEKTVQKYKNKIFRLQPLSLPSTTTNTSSHNASLLILLQTIQSIPQQIRPIYTKIYDKVIQMQIESDKKLIQQRQILNIMECLVSLSKEQIKPQDYVLSQTTDIGMDSLEGKIIRMNQVIIRGLVRKIVKVVSM